MLWFSGSSLVPHMDPYSCFAPLGVRVSSDDPKPVFPLPLWVLSCCPDTVPFLLLL